MWLEIIDRVTGNGYGSGGQEGTLRDVSSIAPLVIGRDHVLISRNGCARTQR